MPSGIMASSPELIRVSSAQANPLLSGSAKKTFQIPPLDMTGTPGIASAAKNTKGEFIFPRVTEISTEDIDPEAEKTILNQLKDLSATEKKFILDTGKKEAAKKVDDLGTSINEKNAQLLKKAKKIDDDIETFDGGDIPVEEAPFTSNVVKPEDTTKKFDFKDIKQRTATEIQNIQNLYTEYANDLSNLKNADILGKTFDKHKEEYIAALQKKPEEATFADVRDAAFDLLNYDKDTLDEQLTKDQQGSVWLNMMRAGLAMAAGESPNALTNVAKGFQIGLEGYGRDMKDLSDDYREDVKTYQSTMYRLLADRKSENIAKNALDVQRKAAEFNIVQQTRGEERKDLLDKLNTEVAMRKIKIESLATMANYDLEKFKLDKSDSEFQEMLTVHKAKIAAMLPDEINAAIAQGLVKVKDENKLMTADNLELTQKGINQQFDLVKELKDSKVTRPSESMQKINISGRTGGYGMQAAPGTTLSADAQEALGLALERLNKSTGPFLKAQDTLSLNPKAGLDALLDQFRPLRNMGIILNYDDLPGFIKNAIESGDEGTVKTYQDNVELFTRSGD